MISKKTSIILAIVTFMLFLLIPISVPCGSPGATCATAPVNNVYYTYSEMEPFGIYLLEKIGVLTNFKYSAKTEEHKLNTN